MSTLSHDDKTPEQPADGDKVFLRDISDTGTGINDGIIVATVDLLGQTIIAGRGAEIKTQYEAQADTNAFTDADHAKLDGIAAGAEVNPTQVTPAEKTAGTETAERSFSPQDIHDMIDTHAPSGGGGGSFSEADLENLMEGKTPAAPAAADEFLFRDVSGTDTVGVATPQQIVEAAHTAMGIEPQNRISTTRDPNASDDGAGTNGVVHIVNDLWTNESTDTSYICQDITTGAAVWAQIDGGAGSGIASVVEDTTPQLGGSLDAQSNSITGVADVEMAEAADHTTAPSAGKGVWWVRNDTPCVPVFTDDAGTDHVLNASGGGGATEQVFHLIFDAPSGTTTQTRKCFTCIPVTGTITDIRLNHNRTIGASGTNYWEIQVHNRTKSVDHLAAAFNTGVAGLTDGVVEDLGAVANTSVDKFDTIQVVWTATGTPTNFFSSPASLIVTVTPA